MRQTGNHRLKSLADFGSLDRKFAQIHKHFSAAVQRWYGSIRLFKVP
ncbi:hypothetical protein PAMC26577_02535 [Caballeronia sordidicola]|uniref:Uncharacterized protein n=1 Tax=Caballeronia sordidicola TaxID=196367 RepID=A0A242N5T0_CABSO|nr:hypothetical protein PAMC26577_02535 [Caballeronia sordidicola]